MFTLKYRLYYQRNLPHYQPVGASLFITFRLAGSIPKEALLRLENYKRSKIDNLLHKQNETSTIEIIPLAQKQLFGLWDTELDNNKEGPHWLADERIANLICESLKYQDVKQYILESYCIMPNHIHLLITPLPIEGEPNIYPLSKIMQSLKGSTARYANKILGRQGEFWQHESYDHVVRDNEEFIRIVHYIMENPIRAGLEPRWAYCRQPAD